MRAITVMPLFILCLVTSVAMAEEDMDFVAEHLPEAMMDARLLSLPLSFPDSFTSGDAPYDTPDHWRTQLQASWARVETGNLSLAGPGVGLGLRRQLGRSWSIIGIGFFDRLDFSGAPEQRPVAPIFSASIPLSLPADAVVSQLRGDQTQYGAGFALHYQPESSRFSLDLGVLRQRVDLNGYRVEYQLTSGPDAGAAGTLDYSADYSFWIPFATAEWRIPRNNWHFAPRFSVALPLPQRGWQGRMEGPGFDVSGDTATIGRGTHMGDPFAGFGLDVTYLPWRLTLEAGALLDQALVEPRIHQGVDRAWLLSFDWEP